MKEDRKALLGAAAIFYEMASKHLFCTGDPTYFDQLQKGLEEKARKAQEDLDAFVRARAARMALDHLMPNWHYVDGSDDGLPREKWEKFVSDDPDEWVEWLISNGVEREAAHQLVSVAFGK